ncbi:hypothetical protein KSS87_017359 [Heliosperma pusillum]|nr:hypothetical protein KSS87_011220 [Heliosperma pusillum]KAH9623075.1 hypothetical protein KSS87_017359 [Heliosperma pusillum]
MSESMEVNKAVSPESYYDVLNVMPYSSQNDIRRAYRKLAMQWHPDKWANTPALLGEAKRKFQKIQEAYSVLSDPRKRMMYDAGMYDSTEEYDEGFSDFMQEMSSLMSQVKQEEVACSMEDLQGMLAELVQGFDAPQWSSGPPLSTNCGCSAN